MHRFIQNSTCINEKPEKLRVTGIHFTKESPFNLLWSKFCCVLIQKLTWWRYQMETFSALLALCEGNPLVTGGFPTQRPVTRSFDACFDLHPNKRLIKQSRRRWFESYSVSFWRHYNGWVEDKMMLYIAKWLCCYVMCMRNVKIKWSTNKRNFRQIYVILYSANFSMAGVTNMPVFPAQSLFANSNFLTYHFIF